ncbi:MAG: branched-chain amino acid transport system II carrier protein, partial [Polaribacter sp.]|nr:branched-chain amino acid transport system II carrier protein [Polaribacter sp.]
ILVGSFQVDFIIILAVPALMFLYPITIVLILLNVIPDKFGSKIVFRAVVFTTFLFSIPDFLGFIIDEKYLVTIKNSIPLANNNMGWVLPSLLVFVLVNFWDHNKFNLTQIYFS